MDRKEISERALEGLANLTKKEVTALVLEPGVPIEKIQPGCDLRCPPSLSPYRGLVVYVSQDKTTMLSLDRSKGRAGLFFALVTSLGHYDQSTGDLNWGSDAHVIWPEDKDYNEINLHLLRIGM